MRIVELTGPSGAGKSAIYAEMLKHGGFIPNPSPHEAAEMAEGALKWTEAADFISFLGWVFRTAKDHDGRLAKRESGTVRALAKLYMARVNSDPRWMAVDGGLIHRGQGIDRLQPKMPTSRYFELMPLPDMVVSVSCPRETLEAHNRARGGDHDRSNDIDRSIACHEMGVEILKRRGARIVVVDTSTISPENAAHAILKRMGILRKFSGEHADRYDEERQDQEKRHAERRVIESFLDDLPPGTSILDAGCGTGWLFDYFASKGFIVRGLDIEADMLAKAGKKIANPTAMIGDVAQWRLIHGDVRDTKLPDKSIDCAVVVRVTRWLSLEACQHMLREMQRVARQRIVFTARVRNHEHARPYDMIWGALQGWKVARDEAGSEPDYRIIELRPI